MDKKRLLPIVLIIFTNILGAGAILPVLPLYAEGQFQGTIIQITLLSSSFFAAQFIAAPYLGRLSDRVGRRPVLIISQVGTVIAFILFIFAGPIGLAIDRLNLALPMTGGMVMLFIARILDGITGGNITTAQAYITDVTPPEHRAQGLGLLQAAFGVGFIFGPAFGGFLGNFGALYPFIGAAIITGITLLLTIFILEESLAPENRRDTAAAPAKVRPNPVTFIRQNGALATLFLIGFLASLGFSAIPATFALYADKVLFPDVSPASRVNLYVGLLLTFIGLMQVITQLKLLRPLVTRYGEKKMILIGQAALLLAYFSISQVNNVFLLILLLAPFSFGQGVNEPGLGALVTKYSDKRTHGQYLGMFQSARSLALILGPIWAGYVFTTISPQSVFFIAGCILLAAFAITLAFQRTPLPSTAG